MKFLSKLFGNKDLSQEEITPSYLRDNIVKGDSTEIPESLPHDAIGNITFSILPNGNFHITCEWISSEIAMQYGEMLHKINEGYFAEEIVHILLDYMKRSPKDALVITGILQTWQMIRDDHENQPFIRPSNVFASPMEEMGDLE